MYVCTSIQLKECKKNSKALTESLLAQYTAHVYIHTYVHTCSCTYIYMYVCMYTHNWLVSCQKVMAHEWCPSLLSSSPTYIHIYVCTNIRMYVRMRSCIAVFALCCPSGPRFSAPGRGEQVVGYKARQQQRLVQELDKEHKAISEEKKGELFVCVHVCMHVRVYNTNVVV